MKVMLIYINRNQMENKIVSIIQIFPHFKEKIDFLIHTDEDFQELCLDHILCAAMIVDIKEKLNKHTEEIEEYEELQRNLEEEILQMILKPTNEP